MADAGEKLKEVVEEIEHPIETAKELAAEAEQGRTARTPLIAITGVTLVAGAVVLVVLALAMTLYFVYGGR
jgi:hypothetical protein